MKPNSKFSLIKQFKSFKYAINGIIILFKEEHNARVHLFFMLLAIAFGIIYKISVGEWLVLVILFALVFSFELINSAIENLCNYISPEYDVIIGKIKDLSAAAVLVVSLSSFIVGLIIFVPKVFNCCF